MACRVTIAAWQGALFAPEHAATQNRRQDGAAFRLSGNGNGRHGASRRHVHPARRYPHAGLHAGRHGCHRKGHVAGTGARDRGRYPAGQHLSSDAAPHRRADCAAGRSAQIHELGPPDPDRFRWLSGDVAGRPAQTDRRGRALFQPYRRIETHAVARTQHGDPKAARF